MYNLIKQCNSGWQITTFAAKLVSNKPRFYRNIVFITTMKILRWLYTNENILTIWFPSYCGNESFQTLHTGPLTKPKS